MIGNDVVDLQLAAVQSNWRRKGFLEKAFSAEEQQQILSSKEPSRLVWFFWSMKEAAYKAHQRRFDLPRRLNWQELNCSLTSDHGSSASGVVRIQNSEYLTISKTSEDYVFTSAKTSENIRLKKGIFEKSSAEMKQLFLQQLSEAYKMQVQQLQLHKNLQGIPVVNFQNQTFFSSFSFSSHGRYSAFSMAVNDL